MAKPFPPEWLEKTKRLNSGKEIKRGNVVIDSYGNKGVVVEVRIPDRPSVVNHGTITVWQSERTSYGLDNCEHYCWFGWTDKIRILED